VATDPSPESARRARREILIYGVCCGVLVAVLHAAEYRLLLVESSWALYGALVAVVFAAVGIGLGRTMGRRKPLVVVREVPAPDRAVFAVDEDKVRALAITPRELEILGLIAGGLSNREIAARLFVSENTVKTHSSRLFDKLGAKRRTQAVQIGKAERLIP
jgi:DNA-binding CsgD family transcriptional regulator